MSRKQSSTLLNLLDYQVKNLVNYPNIQPNSFDSLQRQLLRYRKRTYGLKFFGPIGAPTSVRFLVLAVHGAKTQAGGINKGATGRNVIYLANQMYNFPPRTQLVLNTPKNPNRLVTVMRSLGSGAFEVNETLTVDILTINASGKDLKSASAFPYAEFTVGSPLGNNQATGSVNTSSGQKSNT